MLLSMTGFGSAVAEYKNKKFTFELRSLNSKQLDLGTRVPAPYRQIELEMRNVVARTLERGKAELSMTVETKQVDASAHLDIEVLKAYKRQIQAMAQALEIPQPQDWYSVLLRFPDTMRSDSAEELNMEESRVILEGVGEATRHLMDYRRAEGRKLEEFFTERIRHIEALLHQVPQYETQRVAKIRSRIEEGLAAIPKVDYDRSRLEQEMIFYIEKLDITEEKQRLAQHIAYFLETMQGPAGQGKKLGFISQEMGREINTLGSKSNQADMQILVVKMKDELEQIKEQVLNVM